MPTDTPDTVDPVARLRRLMEDGTSIRQLALRMGISAAYLSDVLAGNRPPGPKILGWLGLEKVPESPPRYRAVRATEA